MLTFAIPMPPSLNNVFANVPGRGRVKTERYRTWREAAKWSIKLDGNKPRFYETITGPFAIEIVCNPRGDLDNRAKGVLDLLVDMKVIADDSRADDIHLVRGGVKGQAIVSVWAVNEAAQRKLVA